MFSGFSDTPLWRAEMALPQVPAATVESREDVLVVGSGFTGLYTALHLARGGRQVVVCDAGEIGWGCSTRNGGQVSSEMKPDLDDFIAKYGEDRARAILSTGIEAHRHLRQFVAEEGIACNYSVCGHFIGAHRPDRMEGLRHFLRQNARLGVEGEEVQKGRVSDFVASPQFHGGVHLPDWASLHPGRLVAELVRLCLAAGVRFVPHCRVSRIEDHVDHITCLAGIRTVRAAHLVMATDGYTDGASKWMRRRVVSLASVVTATEAMDPAAVRALYPRASMVYDTRMNVTYHRPSPDGDRVVIGTVVPVKVDDVAACLPRVRRNILRLFPQLEGVKIAHVWTGFVGATFSHRPHGDGFLSSRGTFQRYYTQVELRSLLLETLHMTPIAAGPGIFFVFRDEELEQRVLSRRQTGMGGGRPILSVPRPESKLASGPSWRQEVLASVRNDFIDLLLTIGRVPHADEIPPDLRMRLADGRLSIKAAIADALEAIPAEEMVTATAYRAEQVGRFFALGAFSGRAPYRRLSPELQRDIRAFFGSQSAAEGVGRRMLFDAGDTDALAKDAQAHAEAGVGLLFGDKYQIHARDLQKLTPRLRTYIGIAQTLAGTLDSTTIYRVHLASRKLTALLYPDFDTSALPRLSVRTKVDLRTGEVAVFDHQADGQVSVLMEKSHYMAGNEDRYEDQSDFDSAMRNLFGDSLSTLPFAEVASAIMRAGLRLPPY